MKKTNGSLIQFITAFIVMTIILYIFIKKSNLHIEQKIDINNKSINTKIDKFQDTMTKDIDTIDMKQNYMVSKQFEVLDTLSNHTQLIEEANKLSKQNNSLLKSINKKQTEILKMIKDEKNYLP